MIIETTSTNGFNSDEHLPDPNENGTDYESGDHPYLMYDGQTSQNTSSIRFSNPTRRQIDLTNKESVEQ